MSPAKNLNQTESRDNSSGEDENPQKTEENQETKPDKACDEQITRMFILGPSANISSTELVRKLHMMELPLTIKTTCYGAAISGDKDAVMNAVGEIRKVDPYNIFTKDRGFPPGDPRRCRAKRGGAREGFHQLEKEFELLDDVSKALKTPRKVKIKKIDKISPDEFRVIAENCK
jgi:putative methanogenesis marker protein 6